jgi:hypothetical protein
MRRPHGGEEWVKEIESYFKSFIGTQGVALILVEKSLLLFRSIVEDVGGKRPEVICGQVSSAVIA